MSKTMRQIDFNEALKRTQNDEAVYVMDIKTEKPSLKLFKRLTIEDAVKNAKTYIFQIIEEVKK